MPGFLHEITLHKQKEIAFRKAAGVTSTQVKPASGRLLSALRGDGEKFICEIKPSSPSAGTLRAKVDLDAIVPVYEQFADCMSVLTDFKYFGGSLEVLSGVASRTSKPVLCKDFIIDPFQIHEARAAGAEAVLLIVKLVGDSLLSLLHEEVRNLGMTPVIEIQNEAELERALALQPDLLLINNRDLDTFHVDLETTERLAPLIPPAVLAVSASGVNSRRDVERLLPFCSRFLIGSALMQSEDIAGKLLELTGAPA